MAYSGTSFGGDISCLVGFDIPNQLYPPELLEWRKYTPVVMPQSCKRQLWFFSQDDMAKFPADKVDAYGIKLMHGKEVYHHLLKVIVGADSPHLGETNIAGQFNEGWAKFMHDHPDHAQKFDRIVQNLWMDSNLIRTHFVSAFQSKRNETAVRYLNDPKGGEIVLIIGEVNADGTLAHTTNYLARAFGNNKKASAEIVVTHPNPEVSAQVYDGLVKMKEKGMLKSSVAHLPFEDLAVGFEVADIVLIATPMRQDPEADMTIISTWKNRSRTDNKITHLRGDPFGHMGGSTPEWEEAELSNYFSVEDVRSHAAAIERKNNYLLVLTKEAIEYCARCRSENLRPDKKLLAGLSKLTTDERDVLFIRAAFDGRIELNPN